MFPSPLEKTTAASHGPETDRGPGGGIRARAIVVGLLLVPFDCWWAMRTEIVNGGSEMVEASLLIVVVFLLFALVLINEALRRRIPRVALTRTELLFVYILQTTSVGLAGLGQIQFLNQALAGGLYFAKDNSGWSSFQHDIPRWWVPNHTVLRAYYLGHSTFFTADHIRGWAVPIAAWTAFIVTMQFCFLCLNTMLRKHWIENERLTFPLVALPLELTNSESTRSLLRQKSFWIAFALVCIFRSISGLHRVIPDFPAPPEFAYKGQIVYMAQYFNSPPWNAIGYFALSFHPIIIGITYLVPLDVAFSSWFFYLVVKAENIVSAAFGLNSLTSNAAAAPAPYTAEQGAGAFLAIALLSLWGARRHLMSVFRKAIGADASVRDDNEPLSYRTAVFGFVASFIGLVTFVTLGGMTWYLPTIFFALYLLMIVTITRLRAEAGPMLNYGPDVNVHQMMVDVPGSSSWSEHSLTPFAYLTWFDSDYRTVEMPQQLEALKMADQVPALSPRHMSAWIMVACLVAAVASFVSVLSIYYHYGALSPIGDSQWRITNGQTPFDQIETWLRNPTGADMTRVTWILVGAAIVTLLTLARLRIPGWPFHPAGFVLAHASWTMPWVWFAVFLGWMAKSLILRYGGLKLYRQALPFFMGLILGDVVIAVLWSIAGVITGTPMYMFFPG